MHGYGSLGTLVSGTWWSNVRTMVISRLLKEHFNVFSFMSVFLRVHTRHVVYCTIVFNNSLVHHDCFLTKLRQICELFYKYTQSLLSIKELGLIKCVVFLQRPTVLGLFQISKFWRPESDQHNNLVTRYRTQNKYSSQRYTPVTYQSNEKELDDINDDQKHPPAYESLSQPQYVA